MNTIVIGCDDAAFSMKHTIIDMLKSLQMTVEDVGCCLLYTSRCV